MPPHPKNLPRNLSQAQVPRSSGYQESLLYISTNASLTVHVVHDTWEAEVGELLESNNRVYHPEQHSVTPSQIKPNLTPEKKFTDFLVSLLRKNDCIVKC